MDLPNTCLNGILGNAFESTILSDYLNRKVWSIKDFLGVLCDQLDSGTLSARSHGITVTPPTVVCHVCAKDLLKKLAYDYRKTIPEGELPAGMAGRPDCYWGIECRTQYTNPNHARCVCVCVCCGGGSACVKIQLVNRFKCFCFLLLCGGNLKNV